MRTIFVAGHNGMVGSAICRELQKNEANVILTSSKSELNHKSKSSKGLLTERDQTKSI